MDYADNFALGTRDLLPFASWAASASHTSIPSANATHLPSSSPWVFSSPPPSVFSSTEGARVVGMCIGATARSVYKAAGLSTSGARFCGLSGANERYLNGVGRKSACSVDCSVELGDFVRIRRSGLSRIYQMLPFNHLNQSKGISLTGSSPTTRCCHETSHQQREVQPLLCGLCLAIRIPKRCLDVGPFRSQPVRLGIYIGRRNL